MQSWFADRNDPIEKKIKVVRESVTGMSFKLSREDKIYERGRFGPMNNDCSLIIQRRKSYMGTGTYMCIAVVEIGNNSLLIVPVF